MFSIKLIRVYTMCRNFKQHRKSYRKQKKQKQIVYILFWYYLLEWCTVIHIELIRSQIMVLIRSLLLEMNTSMEEVVI